MISSDNISLTEEIEFNCPIVTEEWWGAYVNKQRNKETNKNCIKKKELVDEFDKLPFQISLQATIYFHI